jgi:hypothetical protein
MPTSDPHLTGAVGSGCSLLDQEWVVAFFNSAC